MNFYKKKDLNIAEQVACLKNKYPDFRITNNYVWLKATGSIQPTARSVEYTTEIKFKLGTKPEISILDPKLERNFNNDKIPHIYPGEKLCLYLPWTNQFTYSDFIALTIVPWISLWLYYYELWHITGVWYGGGQHPR